MITLGDTRGILLIVGGAVGVVVLGFLFDVGLVLGLTYFEIGVFLLGVLLLVWLLLVWLVLLSRRVHKLEEAVDDVDDRRRADYKSLERQIDRTDEILEDFVKEARGYLEGLPEVQEKIKAKKLLETEIVINGVSLSEMKFDDESLREDVREVVDDALDHLETSLEAPDKIGETKPGDVDKPLKAGDGS